MPLRYRIWVSGTFGEPFAEFTEAVWKKAGRRGIVVQVDAPPQDVAITTPDNPFGDLVEWAYPADFEIQVDRNLRMIQLTHTGGMLLRALSENPHDPVVVFACSPGVGNCVRSRSDDALNAVAREVITKSSGALMTTQTALKQASGSRNLRVACTWLARRICQTSVLTWPETYPEAPFRAPAPSAAAVSASAAPSAGAADGARFVTELARDLEDWLGGNPFFDMAAKYRDPNVYGHIMSVTIAALDRYAPRGAGSGASIGWNIDPDFLPNRERPPGVGLAHELLHAYFSAGGMQPGRDDGHWSTILFEYRCVGLGPWADDFMSENGVRSGWWLVRALFPGYWLNLSNNGHAYPLDERNHRAPHRRRDYYGGGYAPAEPPREPERSAPSASAAEPRLALAAAAAPDDDASDRMIAVHGDVESGLLAPQRGIAIISAILDRGGVSELNAGIARRWMARWNDKSFTPSQPQRRASPPVSLSSPASASADVPDAARATATPAAATPAPAPAPAPTGSCTVHDCRCGSFLPVAPGAARCARTMCGHFDIVHRPS
jgi:hypothetical protein